MHCYEYIYGAFLQPYSFNSIRISFGGFLQEGTCKNVCDQRWKKENFYFIKSIVLVFQKYSYQIRNLLYQRVMPLAFNMNDKEFTVQKPWQWRHDKKSREGTWAEGKQAAVLTFISDLFYKISQVGLGKKVTLKKKKQGK